MTTRQVLFVQGGGAGTHDEWDDKLADSLSAQLGAGFNVRYPRMPAEDDPNYARWGTAIRQELKALDEGAVVIGHSIGGTILIQLLAEQVPPVRLSMVMLLAAPFVGVGGWSSDEFEAPSDLGAKLPCDTEVHIFQGRQDDTTPPEHGELYARAIPAAHLHWLAEGDHQLNNDLREVASLIRAGVHHPTPVRRAGRSRGSSR